MQLLKLRNFGFTILMLASALVIFSCGDKEEPEPEGCVTTDLTYDNYAKAFLTSNCGNSGCHSAADNSTNGDFTDYDNLKAATYFTRIKGAINHDAGFSSMPKGENKLADCDIEKLSAWLDDGAPE